MNKEVKQGSTTTISCVITGITDTATVTWRTSTGEVSGDEFTATQGSHSEGTQTFLLWTGLKSMLILHTLAESLLDHFQNQAPLTRLSILMFSVRPVAFDS